MLSIHSKHLLYIVKHVWTGRISLKIHTIKLWLYLCEQKFWNFFCTLQILFIQELFIEINITFLVSRIGTNPGGTKWYYSSMITLATLLVNYHHNLSILVCVNVQSCPPFFYLWQPTHISLFSLETLRWNLKIFKLNHTANIMGVFLYFSIILIVYCNCKRLI